MTSDATRLTDTTRQIDSRDLLWRSRLACRLGKSESDPTCDCDSNSLSTLSYKRRILTKIVKFPVFFLLILVASQSYGQNAFTGLSETISAPENTDISTISGKVSAAVNNDAITNFTFQLDANGQRYFRLPTSDGALSIEYKDAEKRLDYESGTSFSFTISSTRKPGVATTFVANSYTLTINLTNVDEKPYVLPEYAGTDGKVFYVQRRPNVGPNPTANSFSVFRDPERVNIQFKLCADDFEIEEFNNPADLTSTAGTRGEKLTDAAQTGTGRSRHCFTAPTTGQNPAQHDVERGGDVVNVNTLGQTIQINPVTADSPGVRKAVLTFHGWAGPPDLCATACQESNLKLTPAAKITVYVKTGENNAPFFVATGYQVTVNESLDNTTEIPIGPPTVGAWDATDLDSNDKLTYRLEGRAAPLACRTMTGGTVIPADQAVAVGRGCVWLEVDSNTNNVSMKGKNIDYETAPPSRTYIVTLVASDGYNAAMDARVPVNIIVRNVDEGLEFSGPINQISQLVAGRAGRSVDLNDHFSDPDGTPISYTAISSNPTLVTVSLKGSVLTVNPVGPAGSTSVVVTAVSGGSANPQVIPVSVRETNQAPTFVGGVARVNAERAIVENEPTDTIVRVPGLRYSDPDGDSITATVVNSAPFELVVDPKIGTQTHLGEIAVKLVGRLDFETSQQHVVEVQLNDGWDLSTRTASIVVTVADHPEAPQVATDAAGTPRTIPDQTVAVNGTGSVNVAEYFSDPEGARLQFNAVAQAGGSQFASVSMVGFSTVQFQGLQATGNAPVIVVVTATDPSNLSATITFRVFVSSNNPPQLVRQPVVPALRVGTASTIPLSGTFTDNDEGDRVLRYEASSNDESIVLAQVSSDGLSMVLIPRAEGSTTVVITAIDTRGGRNTTNVTVTVLGNVPPVIETPIGTVELRPNQTGEPIDLNTHFSDPDGDTLTFTATADQPNIATVTVEGSSLTIRARNRGLTAVSVTATDPDGESVRMTFLVAVINDPPSAQTPITLELEHRGDTDTVDLTTIFTDPDNDALTFTASIADEMIATVSIEGSTLTVEAIGVGESEVTVTATDAFGLAGMSTFTVTIANRAPVVAMEIDDQETDRTMMIMVDLSMVFSDPDGDALTYTATVADSTISNASIDGAMLTVNNTAVGTTTVTVTASDEFGDSVSTSFDVTVVNKAPEAVEGAIASIDLQVGGEAVARDVSTGFTDDDSTPLVITASTVNEAVATATVSGMMVSVSPVSRGGTMVEITATDTHGASVSVLVGVRVSDSEIKAVANTALASFSRTVLNSVSSTLGARLIADADGLYTPFAMYSLDDFAPTDGYAFSSNNTMASTPYGIDDEGWATTNPLNVGVSPQHNQFNQLDALFGRGFALKLAAAGDPMFWSIWGGLDAQSFEAPDHEGSATSFYFGADLTLQGQWTFGVGIGRTAGEVDYSYGSAMQKMDNELTQFIPYARMQPSDRTTVYAAFGIGSGSVETTVIGNNNDKADLKGTLGLLGGRQIVFTTANGLNLAVVGDYGFSNLETDEGDAGANNLLAEVTRLRAGLETSFNMLMGADGSFSPFLTVGFRSDGGDGLAESGVEISGGIRITNPIMSVDANFRTLATYGADDYSETGFAIAALLNPTAGATGLSISLSPSWGASAVNTNAMWRNDLDTNRVPNLASWGIADRERMRIDSNIGYGFLVVDERFLLTPFIDVQSGYSDEHDVSFGAKLSQFMRVGAQSLDVSVQVGENSSYSGTQEESIKVNARLNF